MYAGKVVEHGTVDDVFYRSAHPYTVGLKEAMPTNDPSLQHELQPIEGSPPDLFSPPVGCGYCARCPYAMNICEQQHPSDYFLHDHHYSRCWLHEQQVTAKPSTLYFGGEN